MFYFRKILLFLAFIICSQNIWAARVAIITKPSQNQTLQHADLTKKRNSIKVNSRFAVVDVESILENSVAIKGIKKDISKISMQIQSEFSTKEMELKKIESELIKKRGVIEEEDFNSKIADFNKKVSQIQREMQTKKSALEQAHSKAISEVHRHVLAIIAELSQKYYFDVVMPSNQVLFVRKDLNVTYEVIDILNSRLQKVNVNYKINSQEEIAVKEENNSEI